MPNYQIRILEIIPRTHDVRSYRMEKPANFQFIPGHAADVSIMKPGWENEKRPFTFTSLPDEDTLEFTIKSYDHDGVTKQIGQAKLGDCFEISDSWGAIEYKGPGIFIAGGAGITPFIAIFRDLYRKGAIKDNKLFFSNKTEQDIILKEEFEKMLGSNFINIITRGETDRYLSGRINEDFIKNHISDLNKHFYVCGPDSFNENLLKLLENSGASTDMLVFEK